MFEAISEKWPDMATKLFFGQVLIIEGSLNGYSEELKKDFLLLQKYQLAFKTCLSMIKVTLKLAI